MRIKNLKVKNFRSLKEIEVHFDDKVTCIVGENDAGKTSLLKCIELFSSNLSLKDSTAV